VIIKLVRRSPVELAIAVPFDLQLFSYFRHDVRIALTHSSVIPPAHNSAKVTEKNSTELGKMDLH
jgi:hypothetical protein